MAISPQRLTIYLYSTHRAGIFAIAQLSCLKYYCFICVSMTMSQYDTDEARGAPLANNFTLFATAALIG